MSFKLIKKLSNGVRIGELETAHGTIKSPFFMPVGTVGSVKSVAPSELEDLGAQIVLSNTYHLYLRPGEQLIKKLGGLHHFMRWDKPILTDSGGYQVFSLAKNATRSKGQEDPSISGKISTQPPSSSLVKITDSGVEFKSHLDGSKHLFTPEKVIDIQLDLGVDILMPMDVCPSGKASRQEVEKSVKLTVAWAKRSKEHFDKQISLRPELVSNDHHLRPLLHGIVQGGLYPDLREKCAHDLIVLDLDGYSVGGLAVDLETRDMWEIVRQMGEILPQDKQRYLMGVGTPDDIIMGVKLGMDMFDCVLPTRMARHGSVYIKSSEAGEDKKYKLLNLLNSKFREDGGVIDPDCACPACQCGAGFSRAYISHLLRSNEILGLRNRSPPI